MTLEEVLQDPEYIPYVRRWLFEQLAAGLMAPERAVAIARRIGVELEAGGYAVALFDLPPKSREAGFFADPAAGVRSGLLAYFLKYSEYMPVQLGPDLGAVLIKGDARRLPELTERCIRTVREQYERAGVDGWHIAVSPPADGLAGLDVCCREAFQLWSLRVLRPDRQVFRPGEEIPDPAADGTVTDGDLARADPAVIEGFLRRGRREDVPAFVRGYMEDLGPAMEQSRAFREHVLFSARAAAGRFAEALDLPGAGRPSGLGPWPGSREPERFLEATLAAALALRDQASGGGAPGGTLAAAVEYVNGRFTDPDLTLGRTAGQAGVTASYLSALFRRELGCTFTQYVNGRRLELAKRLLRASDRPAGQIAREAGFRDAHYFGALFKKTQGCTPGQFRAGPPEQGVGPSGDLQRRRTVV